MVELGRFTMRTASLQSPCRQEARQHRQWPSRLEVGGIGESLATMKLQAHASWGPQLRIHDHETADKHEQQATLVTYLKSIRKNDAVETFFL
jgi:hypothetical protein